MSTGTANQSSGGATLAADDIETLEKEFEALGLRSTEARVMVALLAAGSGTAATLSRLARMPRPAMYAVLDSLENLGLAVALGGKVATWSSPGRDRVLELLLMRQGERLRLEEERQRKASAVVARLLPDADGTAVPFVQVIRDAAQYRHQYERLLRGARSEVLSCTKPPYSWTAGEPNPVILDTLGRIASGRALVQATDFLGPEAQAFRSDTDAYVAAGLQVRLVDELPLKVAIVDRETCLASMGPAAGGEEFPTALLIDDEGYAAFAAEAFERLWESGRPYEGGRL